MPRGMALAIVALASCVGALALAHSLGWTNLLFGVVDLGPVGVDPTPPPGDPPSGMVWIPGGVFWMGDIDVHDAVPVHKVAVDGFWMDKTEVTNAQFRKFVEATKYVTVAEKTPDYDAIIKQIPKGQPLPRKEDLVPGSLVFTPPREPLPVQETIRCWRMAPGAYWREPEGPGSDLTGRDQWPVVHVAFADALAYCEWRSKNEGGTYRLPTEAEWEFAARGGLDRKPYVWGDEAHPKGAWMANTWQGQLLSHNTKLDGFAGIAPVGSFPANGFGLYDMAGNVWEWCGDWYRPKYDRSAPGRNPRGPDSSFDPQEPEIAKRVQRGGSYLCAEEFCRRYLPGARGKGDPDSSSNHIGFRTVRAK